MSLQLRQPDSPITADLKICLTLLIIGLTNVSQSQWSIASIGQPHVITFDSSVADVADGAYNGAGFAPTPGAGQLDSDAWRVTGLSDGSVQFGATQTSGDFARGYNSTGVTTGGLYAFGGTATDRTFGVQPTGSDFTPGVVTLMAINNSGSDADSIEFAYTLYVRNNATRGNYFRPYYSFDNSAYTSLPTMNYTSQAAISGLAWLSFQLDTVLPVSWFSGDTLYLQWRSDDVSGGGSRDEFGLDNISLTALTGDTSINTGAVTQSPYCMNSTDSFDITVPFNSVGTYGSGNYYKVQLSDGNGSFANPVDLDSINSAENIDTIWTDIPSGTPAGNGYRVRVVSSDPLIIGEDNGIDIVIAAEVIATLDLAHVDCNGAANGIIQVTVGQGIAPITYTWSNSDSVTLVDSLMPGGYAVTITDSVGCSLTLSDTITEPDELGLTSTANDASCHGYNDGSVNITVSGGVEPYDFQWSGGQTTEDLVPVGAGMHTVTITDDNGCTIADSVEVNEPLALSYDANLVDESCGGYENGSIAIVNLPTGGLYTFDWSNGANESNITDLPQGEYLLTITDFFGCETLDTFEITGPAAVEADITVTDATCNTCDDGEATAQPTGGSSPYTYAWSNGETTATATGLEAGNHTVTITDDNGCEYEFTAEVGVTVGIRDLANVTVKLYPNPFSNQLTLRLELGASDAQWHLYDPAGRVVMSGSAAGHSETIIPTHDLNSGVYHLHLQDEHGRTIARKPLIRL